MSTLEIPPPLTTVVGMTQIYLWRVLKKSFSG